jgi:hypothetical protein
MSWRLPHLRQLCKIGRRVACILSSKHRGIQSTVADSLARMFECGVEGPQVPLTRLSKFPLAFHDNGKLVNKKRYFKEWINIHAYKSVINQFVLVFITQHTFTHIPLILLLFLLLPESLQEIILDLWNVPNNYDKVCTSCYHNFSTMGRILPHS